MTNYVEWQQARFIDVNRVYYNDTLGLTTTVTGTWQSDVFGWRVDYPNTFAEGREVTAFADRTYVIEDDCGVLETRNLQLQTNNIQWAAAEGDYFEFNFERSDHTTGVITKRGGEEVCVDEFRFLDLEVVAEGAYIEDGELYFQSVTRTIEIDRDGEDRDVFRIKTFENVEADDIEDLLPSWAEKAWDNNDLVIAKFEDYLLAA